jgi:phage terminase large subunit-like protein
MTKRADPEAIIRFCETLAIPGGDLAGQRMRLADFQKQFIRDAFAPGVRLAILSMGRKGGKTALVSAISCAALVGPARRKNGQIIVGALAQKQASVLYRYARDMLQATPECAGRYRNTDHQKTLTGLDSGTTLQAISSHAGSAMGLSPSLVVLDETGQITAETDPFVDALMTAQGAYSDALTIIISTQAATDNALLSRLIDDIRNNPDDKTRIAHVYEAPSDCALDDESAWHAANPALAAGFRSMEDIRSQAASAERIPAQEGAFRNLILNQRVASSDAFISRAAWDGCRIAPEGLSGELIEPGERVYLGLDLSQSKDLTACALLAADGGGAYRLSVVCWLPDRPSLYERAKQDRAPYEMWHKQGLLRTVPGPVIDPRFMAQEIADILERYDVKGVGYDPWGTRYLRHAAEDLGIHWDELFVEVRQGTKTMTPAISRFLQKVERAEIMHDGNPLLTMGVANAVPKLDSVGNVLLEKRLARGRIDPLVASIIALAVAEDGPGYQGSYLDDGSPLILF